MHQLIRMAQFKKNIFLKRLGAWIAKLRKSRGLGQDKLSSEAGLAKGTLSKIENGTVDPKASTLVKVAHALEVKPHIILDLEAEHAA